MERKSEYNRYVIQMEAKWRCPVCHQPMRREKNTWRCPAGHAYDIAKQGYVNLSRKQKQSGDNRQMVEARTRFLEKGYYGFLREALQEMTAGAGTLADIGCGQGWYTRKLGGKVRYGFDLSREAIRYAARTDRDTAYAIASIYDLPLADESADVMTSIFTPLPEKEARRIIRPGGSLIQVMPGPDHLLQLKELAYPQAYRNPDKVRSLEGFGPPELVRIQKTMIVDDVWDLFEMTPYRYHTPEAGIQRLQNTKSLEVTFDFVIARYIRKEQDQHGISE